MPRDAEAQPHSPHLITLGALAGLSAFTLNTILPALPTIAEEFNVTYAIANLAVAGYLGITAVMQLIAGPLSDRFGRRPLLVIALISYLFGSLICLIASNIEVFLFGRLLQSLSVAGYAISMALIRDLHGPKEAASRIGYVAATMALGLIFGPLLGGLVADAFGWRAVFALYFLAGIIIFALVWFDVEETNFSRASTLRAQMASYPELFGSRRFWGYAVCGAFSTATFFCFTSGVPLVGRDVFDLSPAEVGASMGVITLGFLFGNLLTGKLAKKDGKLTTLMIIGRISALIGMIISLGFLMAGIIGPITFLAPLILIGFGNGLTLPNTNSGMVSIRPKLAGSAAGLGGAFVVSIGGFLTFLTGILVKGASGPVSLLTILLLCGTVALAAAFYVRYVDRITAEIEAKV